MGAVDCRGPVVEAEASGKSPAGSREKGMVALGRGGGPVLDPKQESHTAGFPQHKDQGRAQAQLELQRQLSCVEKWPGCLSRWWRAGLGGGGQGGREGEEGLLVGCEKPEIYLLTSPLLLNNTQNCISPE